MMQFLNVPHCLSKLCVNLIPNNLMLPYVCCQTTLSKSSIKHPGQVTIKMKDMTKMLICSIPLAAPSATRAAAASRGTIGGSSIGLW